MRDSLVIIPTYNEIDNIQAILEKAFSLDQEFDVLVVDDGSPDGTANVVKKLQNQFSERLFLKERSGKLGLGTAYLEGFKFALARQYEFIFEMDSDFSHNPEDLMLLRRACKEEGHDLAVGSRYITGVNVVNWPMGRVLLSYLASKYVRFVTGLPINDATAGFKCYRRTVLETIDLDSIKFVGYAFQIEMKFKAWKLGFKLTEVPIIFINRSKGVSKMSSGIFNEALFGVLNLQVSSWFKPIRAIKLDEPVVETLISTPES